MIFVLAVNCLCKMLITGLGKTVLLIQNIQDTHQLCLNQICKAKSVRSLGLMTETFHANEYEVNSELIYSIPLQKVLSKVKQNSASLMDECKVGGHTRTFLIISAKASVVCIIHLRRAQVREVRSQAQSRICMSRHPSINVRWLMRRHAGKGPARLFGSHKDMCCITIRRIWKAELANRKARFSPRNRSDICDAGAAFLLFAPQTLHQKQDVLLSHLHTVQTQTSCWVLTAWAKHRWFLLQCRGERSSISR